MSQVTHTMTHVTRMNESCRTYEWVMSPVDVPWEVLVHMERAWGTIAERMSRRNRQQRTQTWTRTHTHTRACVRARHARTYTHTATYEWDMSYMGMSHVTPMNESWISHVTHVDESCHAYEWVMSTYEWVISHVWMSHFTSVNELCHTFVWVMSHIRISHVTHLN